MNITSLLWVSPVLLASIAAFLYGSAMPVSKIAMMGGVSPTGMLLCYGITSVIGSLLWWRFGGVPIAYGTGYKGLALALFNAAVMSFTFVLFYRAMSIPGPLSVVMTVVAVAPVISTLHEVLFMGTQIRPSYALLAAVLVVAGGVTLKLGVEKPASVETSAEPAVLTITDN